MLHMPPRQQKSLVGPTYAVTIGMLVIGQIQVSAVMEIKSMKDYLAKRYFVSLIQFFISFLSIQLYGFFYRMIVEKSIWVRILAGLWTYQVNTLSIMKPAQQAPYFCLAISLGVTYIMMGLGAIYGHAARRHERDFAAQGDPLERKAICGDMLRDHCQCRIEQRLHRVSHLGRVHAHV
ncbi:uncharacterized protein LOC110179571 isoform X3 [Drosophila serrata]|uniref:uncharacterized protein LOC110179571 isoform X3 n=1 Tax=Drosophila serrata TaxID=7274 RepID=UPI000A1D26CA|nr:uncharacterized protein LOC110179571 isoform X3 [Drosophila serrata]XP_020802819.1 uncharacterized protein LOC110179571 isoform X3 [Drosophila serrata]